MLPLVNYKYYSTELEGLITHIYIFFCYIDTCLSMDDTASERNSEIGK